MVFSSTVFLFLFLPLTLALYALLPALALRNLLLLAVSLLFYAWGEQSFVFVLLGSIAVNYLFGLAIGRLRGSRFGARWATGAAVAANIGLLAFYKYSNFLADSFSALAAPLGVPPLEIALLHLPIGISFFTFQAMTYVVDVYRGEARPQRNPLNVGLYIAMFPQLVAGPIVRYRDVAGQLTRRAFTLVNFSAGAERFIVGLGKKVLLANTVGAAADRVFGLPAESLTTGLAWLGTACYTFQIYFDFSGYSDMAIGLGRIFGFRFPENFDSPYLSRSLREFWRRWHITLSEWFRDYLYIPLGGSRRKPARVYANLFAVFFLCGLWHGAAWTFVVWGMIHGAFIVLERLGLERFLARRPRVLQHAYLLLVVTGAWVVFRSPSLSRALLHLEAMAGLSPGSEIALYMDRVLNPELALALAACTAASLPLRAWLRPLLRFLDAGWAGRGVLALARTGYLGAVLAASAMLLASGTHNPFIYFRF